jgi:hypothetical protein
MIICISGWKHSGKDSSAEILIKEKGFERLAFADALKDKVSEDYSIPRHFLDSQVLKESPLFSLPVEPKDKFSEMITAFMAKEFRNHTGKLAAEGEQAYWTPRALAILEGSVKRSVNSKYWVDRTLGKVDKSQNYVITDLRYRSEAELVKAFCKNNGIELKIVRISRFDSSPSDDPSERDLDSYTFDRVIENKGTVEDLQNKILTLA